MEIHFAPLFIPFLLILVYLEWQFSKHKQQNAYRLESSILNVNLGIVERIFELYYFGLIFFLFGVIQQQFGIFEISMQNVWHWISAMILLDFIIYWFHRAGHRINFLWGAHAVHHQCREFNLTVAFRNGIFPHIFRTTPMLTLPLLGFPAEMIFGALMVSGVWQMFLHTRSIRNLGILELFMMTPSHHRVHHGSNPEYIDKNFGGMLVIWDRLFGTFAREEAPVKFGITSPVKTWNPIRIYTHIWKDLYTASKLRSGLANKVKILFESPESFHRNYQHINSAARESRNHRIPKNLFYYIILQLIIMMALLVSMLTFAEFYTVTSQLMHGAFLIISTVMLCLLMEKNPRYFNLEKMRLLTLLFLPLTFDSTALVEITIVLFSTSIIWFSRMDITLTPYLLAKNRASR